MPSERIQIRLNKRAMQDLSERSPYFGGPSEVFRTDLYRYRRLIRAAQTRLKAEKVFTPAEQALILDALNGSLLADRPETLSASVDDSMSLDGTAEKWGVDQDVMREKLRGLTPIEFAAIADAAERFWSAPDDRDAEGGLL